MSVAKKCDICGALYEPYSIEGYQTYHDPSRNFLDYNGIAPVTMDNRGGFVPGNPMDCCPTCLKAINDFVSQLGRGLIFVETDDKNGEEGENK